MVTVFQTPQIILRTAFDVRQYKNQRNSPVSKNEIRIQQYMDGSHSFQSAFSEYVNYEITILDNTLDSPLDFPKEFVKLWKVANLVCTRTNNFGKYNKGAGDVETLKHAFKTNIISRDFLFYELRIQTVSPAFIEDFMQKPRNLISREIGGNSVKSGYIGFNYETARDFYFSVSPIRMVLKKTSIEDLLYKNWIGNSREFAPNQSYALRFDPWANKYIPY